jgi:RNA polymerase sigma-70 factor (ECF subfamily)
MDPDLTTDEALLDSFAAGDAEALGRLAQRHERALLGLALGLTGSRELAEVAVQDAWVRVIRSAAAFRGQSSVKTWMYRIVINRSRDLQKQESARPPVAASAVIEPATPELREAIRAALETLQPAHREAVLLCHHADLTHAQAAEVLNIPLGTFKSRVRTALGRLEQILGTEVRS